MSELDILLVEDNALDAELMEAALSAGGLRPRVRRVFDAIGLEAAIVATAPDVVLTDYVLPGFDGLEALAMAQRLAPRAPVLFVSGALGDERAIDVLKRGATDFVLKDRLDRLVPAIHRALRERTAHLDRERAEGALRDSVRRLSALHALISRLAQALTWEEAVDAVVAESLTTLGADWAAVWAVAEDGAELHLVRQRGFPAEAIAAFASIDLDAATPISDAVRTGTAAFIGSNDELLERYPHLAGSTRAQGAVVVLPLVYEGRCLGGLAYRYHATRTFGDDDRQFASTMATQCAQTLGRARLFDAERRARQAAEAAAQSREDLMAIVSHDLRNPLSAIVSGAALLSAKLRNADDGVLRALAIVQRNGERMKRLIADLLDLARIDSGSVRLDRNRHDVGALLREVVDAHEILAENQQLRLTAVAEPGLEVDVDRERILQVFANLVGNALKFTPAGGRIEVGCRTVNGSLLFHVDDTGPGIPDELRSRVFERYWQASHRGERGVGLGLAIVRGLVEAHGGKVWVEPRLGGGSSFRFLLPAVEGRAAA